MNSVTLIGSVATDVRQTTTADGVVLAHFRLVCPDRTWDRAGARWVERTPSFVSVVCWRRLAENVVERLGKGDPVVVTGRLQIKQWERDGRRATAVEVDAAAVGLDLARARRAQTTGATPAA